WVASTTTRPAPEFTSMPRWAKCQSVAQPSTALYWHMGATTTRLSNSTPPSRIGENRVLGMGWGPCAQRNEDLRYIDRRHGGKPHSVNSRYARLFPAPRSIILTARWRQR